MSVLSANFNLADYSLICSTLDEKIKLILHGRLIKYLVLDFVIGFYILFGLGSAEWLHEEFWNYTEILAKYLEFTMEWIVNNPAGLKLNEPINRTLSSFFGYHIYLWTTFIFFLRVDYFNRFFITGLCGGISSLAALLYDFSIIFFIHFKCFDAYATKLWSLCYYTVTRLWGLVRGKKWNPLRERTDNVILDTRQQFLSTSLFVILLFIIPTIFVYFIVFRALRYMVSSIQLILKTIAQWPMTAHDLEMTYIASK